MSLNATDCLLLREEDKEDLVKRFNGLEGQLGLLREKVQNLEGFSDVIDSLGNRLDIIRGKLTRKYYRVGFLGTTGAGKSTTFNNILKISGQDAPAQSGGGEATTAAPSRLRRCQEGPPNLLLNFMTEDDYEKRKKDLATHMGLGGLNEDEILQNCVDLRRQHSNGEIVQANASMANIIALESLVRSKNKYPNLVKTGKKRFKRPADYKDRSNYLNHADHQEEGNQKPDIAENRLLWEVEINLPNEVLPETLEMLDLPGLGASKHNDTCVTRDIIQNKDEDGLDGALIFIRSDCLSDASVTTALTDLQSAWGKRFRGRVWAVSTKFDSLTTDHYEKPNKNFFSGVQKLCKEYDIPEDCIFIISNTIYRALQEASINEELSDNRRIEIATNRTQTGFKLDSPTYQAIFNSYPKFTDCIKQFYLNGGIDYLRSAVVDRLSQMIGKEVADDVKGLIIKLDMDIDSSIKLAERRSNQTEADRTNATKCHKVVRNLLLNIVAGMKEFAEATKEIRQGLQTKAQEITHVEDLAQIESHEIKTCFAPLARNLDDQTRTLFIDQCVGKVYQSISENLGGLPEFPICQAQSIQQAWEKWKADDTQFDNWTDQIPKFDNKGFIDAICNSPDQMTSYEFKSLMENKMDAVTMVSMFRLKERVRNHLDKVANDLRLLSSAQ
jgi:hypothetical protein